MPYERCYVNLNAEGEGGRGEWGGGCGEEEGVGGGGGGGNSVATGGTQAMSYESSGEYPCTYT